MNLLKRIYELTRARIERSKELMPAERLEHVCARLMDCPSLKGAINRQPGEGIKAIAEVKRSSPSRGAINPSLVVEELVRAYKGGGANAISVLTEPAFFAGSLMDLTRASRAVDLPILRKDFIFDRYQLLEAKACGASGVLLIVSLLSEGQLDTLLDQASDLGLEALVEVHDEQEVALAVEAGAAMIGINNRDLQTLEVDLETTARLLPLIPKERVTVSESGYSSPGQVREAMRAGVDAILVGEAVAKHKDPGKALARLKDCGDDLA